MPNLIDFSNVLAYCAGVVGTTGIPDGVGGLIHIVVIIIQVVVPILLIIWGMLDFAKAIIGADEDKIRAGRKTFVQRLIAAVIVFLIVTLVQLMINVVGSIGADEYHANAWTCAKSLISGKNNQIPRK